MAVIEWSWKWGPEEIAEIFAAARRRHLASIAMLDLFGGPDMFPPPAEDARVDGEPVRLTKIIGGSLEPDSEFDA